MRARGHLHFNLPVQGWNVEPGAEYGIGYFDDFPAPQIRAVAFEAQVALAAHNDKQIAGRAADSGTWQTVAWNTQGRTFFDSGRDCYIEIIVLVDFAAPATGFTGFIDEGPLAVANRANGYLLKTDRALVLGFLAGSYLLAAAVALAAGARLATFFRAAALAIPARDRAVEVDCFFTARIDLFQRDGEADFEVTAPDRASGTTVPTEKVAEQTASSERIA